MLGANIFWPYQEQGDFSDVNNSNPSSSWSWSFLRHGLADPILFYALGSATARAMHLSTDAGDPGIRRVTLELETKAITLLREEITSPILNLRDELLFAIMMLFPSLEPTFLNPEPGRLGAFRPVLTTLQHIHIGSHLSYVMAHWNTLRRLVGEIGGIQKVAMSGLGEFINMYASATHSDVLKFTTDRVTQDGSFPSKWTHDASRLRSM